MNKTGKHWNVGENNSQFGVKRYGKDNPNYGRKHPGLNRGEKNPLWKGDDVGYDSLHEWIRNHKSKPELCEICRKEPPYDAANISGKYLRDINDWHYLCRKCHMIEDGRLVKMGYIINKYMERL